MTIELECNLSFLNRADGSCELSNGKTKVWCGVNGPGDVQPSKRIFDRMNILFTINRLPTNKLIEMASNVLLCTQSASSSSNRQRDKDDAKKWTNRFSNLFIESIVRNAIDVSAFPRTCLQVCAQEIKTDGPADSTIINAICLTLLDAGLPLHYIFCSVTVAVLEDARLVIEPSWVEFEQAISKFVFVFKPSLLDDGGATTVACDAFGRFSVEDYRKARDLALVNCLSVFDFYRRKMYEKHAHCIVTTKMETS